MATALHSSTISNLECIHRGKVRDIYAIDDEHMLIVTTDRLSAFDVILPDPIPGKGTVLNSLSEFWYQRYASTIPNQTVSMSLNDVITDAAELEQVKDHAIIVKRLKPLKLEAIVRGYIIGSGWKDYQRTGAICGIALPEGLQQAQQLPEPIYTPSSKADVGEHDQNIDFAATVELVGESMATKVRDVSLMLYKQAAEYALKRGIIIADTKFEFGLDADGTLHLIDEVLTPDSSRFWDAEKYEIGTSPESYDKQIVRDYLETLDWDKTNPGPSLPQEILQRTADQYRKVEQLLTA